MHHHPSQAKTLHDFSAFSILSRGRPASSVSGVSEIPRRIHKAETAPLYPFRPLRPAVWSPFWLLPFPSGFRFGFRPTALLNYVYVQYGTGSTLVAIIK